MYKPTYDDLDLIEQAHEKGLAISQFPEDVARVTAKVILHVMMIDQVHKEAVKELGDVVNGMMMAFTEADIDTAEQRVHDVVRRMADMSRLNKRINDVMDKVKILDLEKNSGKISPTESV